MGTVNRTARARRSLSAPPLEVNHFGGLRRLAFFEQTRSIASELFPIGLVRVRTGQGLLDFYRPPMLREKLAARAEAPLGRVARLRNPRQSGQ